MSPATSSVRPSVPLDGRQREIAEVGARLIAEEGFANTGVRDFAKGIGVSVSTLYDYVRTKEDILVLVIEYWTEQWRGVLDSEAVQGLPPLDRLQAAVDGLIAVGAAHPYLGTLLYREQTRLDKAGRALLTEREKERIAGLSRIVREGIDQGLIRADVDPDFVSATALFLVDALPLRASVAFDVDGAGEWGRSVLDMMLNGCWPEEV